MPKQRLLKPTVKPTKQTNTRYGNMKYFADDPTIGRSLEYYGEYCHREIEMILSFVDESSWYFDIGANIGTHTVSVAPHVHNTVAFEPNEDNFNLLHHNCSQQVAGNVSPTKLALGEKLSNGTCVFDYGKTHIVPGNELQIVPLDMIDGFPRVDFLKIDVEGSELTVLKGAANTIARFKPHMLIEMQDPTTHRETYNFLHSRDYTMYWFPVATFNKYNHNGQEEDIFGSQHGVINWIATVSPIETDLQPVVDQDDTIERAVYRRSQQNVGDTDSTSN